MEERELSEVLCIEDTKGLRQGQGSLLSPSHLNSL